MPIQNGQNPAMAMTNLNGGAPGMNPGFQQMGQSGYGSQQT